MYAKDFLIAIDDGHGILNTAGTAENPGKRTPTYPDGHYVLEDVFNKAAANLFEAACIRCGFRTLQVAPEDTNTPLETRIYRANQARASIFISWHYNAYNGIWDQTKGGISTHYYPGAADSQKLASLVHKHLLEGTPQVDRRIQASDFAVLRETNMPAILIESGFMDVHYDADLMVKQAYQKEQAEQACIGLCEYLGVQYVPEVIPQPIPTQPPVQPSNPIVNLPVGFDEYLITQSRRIIHLDPGTYISLDPDGIRFYAGSQCVQQFISATAPIDRGTPASTSTMIIVKQQVGFDEYLPQAMRRIIHLNNGTYISLDPDGIKFFVNGEYKGGFIRAPKPVLNPPPASIPNLMQINAQPIGYDEYLVRDKRRILHLNAGTYISLDPDAIRFYVNGQWAGEYLKH